jgi:DNA-binding CsgD family transcriptional regulator
MRDEGSDPHSKVAGLTERQRQCLVFVAQGLTSKQIGRRLGISPSTVDNHIHTVVVLLGAVTRHDAARMVVEWGKRTGNALGSNQSAEESDGWPVEPEIDELPRLNLTRFPPFGGKPNRSTISQRLLYVTQIALLGVMLFAAIAATISGVVQLFVR